MVARAATPASALPRGRRLDGRKIAGLFVFCLSLVGGLLYWSSLTELRPLVVATRDLPPGVTLAAGDLAVARLHADDGLYAAAIPGEELGALVGRELAEPVHAQQLLVRAQLATGPRLGPDDVALALPVDARGAVGGRLRPGDAVRVYVTRDRGRPESRTEVVLERARVLDVGRDDGQAPVVQSGADGASRPTGGPLAWLTVAVPAADGPRTAQAANDGAINVALLPADR
jgi:Flp pilus assembly protein CpaB